MTTERLRRLLNQSGGIASGSIADMMDATEHEKKEFLKMASEAANRRREALRLYEPLSFQEAYHRCTAKELILAKGNRVGGSLGGFVEDARAVTNQDPYKKYPVKDGICVCLGYGENHVGRVIHKFLFRPGAFKIIRDQGTGYWRVFRPWPEEQGGDAPRVHESEDAPPLIPPRLIEDFHWESRGARVFSRCQLKTGWEIYALNSAGDPSQAQGFDVDLYHIDEDTAQAGWYEEAIGRVALTNGKIRWTALPHSRNDDILNMMERAKDQESMETPTTVCLRASIWDNPFIPEESRNASIRAWRDQGDDVVRKRAYGELIVDSVLMYPSFGKYTHDIVCQQTEYETLPQAVWRKADYTVPAEWCCDMIVDPGHTVAAALFIATPPPHPKLGELHVVYNELYLHQCTAAMLANEAKKASQGRQMERWIIDAHGGRLTDFGSGVRPQRQYEVELERRGLSSNMTGSHFIHGCDIIEGREESLRRWLRIQDLGWPSIYVDMQRCPNLVRELLRFKKKQQRVGSNTITLDEANRRGPCHAVECLEMAAAHGLEYVQPRSSKRPNRWVQQILSGRRRRETRRSTRDGSPTSGSISLAPRGATEE